MVKCLAMFAAVVALFGSVSAQEVEQLGPSTWALLSEDARSSNSVVFGGEEYTLLVDPGRTPAEARARIDLAEALTGTGVQKVVLTSADPGAVLGVLLLEPREFEVSCHEETRRYLAENAAAMLRAEREAAATPEEVAVFDARRFRLPDLAIGSMQRYHLGKHRLRAAYVPNARTGGDLALMSRKDSVMAGGSVLFHGRIPEIPERADLRAWLRGLGALTSSGTKSFVASRGDVLTAEQIAESRLYLDSLLEGVEPEERVTQWKSAPEPGASTIAENVAAAARFKQRTQVAEKLGLGESKAVEPSGAAIPRREWRAGTGGFVRALADSREVVVHGSGSEPIRFSLDATPTGVAVTADERVAFVPLGAGGRIACIDLFNLLRLPDALVGGGAGEGDFIEGDTDFVLPVASKSSLAFVNTASREITGLLNKGLGLNPLGVAVSPNGRFGIVWSADSARLTLVDLKQRRVIAHEDLEAPITRASFAENRLRLAGSDPNLVVEYTVPEGWLPKVPVRSERTQVAVMGMTHSGHLDSELWGLDEVAETMRNYAPDAVLAEIPPERWAIAWEDYAVRGVVEESRVKVFPEYREMLFDLAVELGFGIEPCAAWTEPMNNLRRERLRVFNESADWATQRAELERIRVEVQSRWEDSPVQGDDPAVIHTDEYDRFVKDVMDPVGQIQNEWVGPGGWYNINRAHMELVHEAIDRRPGQRLLVTFGAYHKYMFLEELRAREDVELIELGPFLPKSE